MPFKAPFSSKNLIAKLRNEQSVFKMNSSVTKNIHKSKMHKNEGAFLRNIIFFKKKFFRLKNNSK